MRGGGHHIAGNAVAEGGLMIDLSGMRTVSVDAAKRTARVGPGALLADFDREPQAHGLATPLGINSTTGVAGLTLGGGFGWLTRRHGLTIDNLLGATVVTADGAVRVVSATSEPDLFWALRGGGGNFGVVTSFEFQLHPVGPEVYAGLVVYPFAQARQVLRAWRDFTADAPDELSVWTVLRKAPPLPFLPASAHGTEVVIFPLVYSGDVDAGQRAAAPVLQFGDPIGTALAPTPYAGFQPAFDPLLTPGGRNYWKSNNFSALSDAALDVVIASAGRLPGPECEIFVAQLGGAMARVKPTATAFVGRDARYIMNVHGRWSDARDDERVRAWARRVFRGRGAARHRQRLRQLPDRGRSRARRRELRRELPAPAGREAALRPGQPVPHEPQHRAGRRATASGFAMSSIDARGCSITGADAGRAGGVRTRARRVPELAQRRRRAACAGAAGGARLRDGARAAGLPAAVQSRSASASDRRARCWRAPRRCRPTSASDCTSPRSPPCSPTTTNAPRRCSASCCAGSRATCWRCRWRTRSTTSPATSPRMSDRVAAVLPAWSSDLPGYHAVLAMHAFGLEECGEYERAERGRPRRAGR